MTIKSYFRELLNSEHKRPAPLAYYPSRKLIGASFAQIVSDSDIGSECLQAMSETFRPALLVRMAEFWVEAEAFGAEIAFSENDFPKIKTKVAANFSDIEKIEIPDVSAGRLPVFVETIRKARSRIPDIPIFAGVTGPYSFGGCLTDSVEFMMGCISNPDMTHSFLEKITSFLISYCEEYKKAGSSGVIIAEPTISLISPKMAEEFSHVYVKKIISQLQSDDFAVAYHNCGDISKHLNSVKDLGAMAYHFGDAFPFQSAFELFPEDTIIMGNVHPIKFSEGSEKTFRESVNAVKAGFSAYPNFVLSSGCDLAPDASIDSIKYFME